MHVTLFDMGILYNTDLLKLYTYSTLCTIPLLLKLVSSLPHNISLFLSFTLSEVSLCFKLFRLYFLERERDRDSEMPSFHIASHCLVLQPTLKLLHCMCICQREYLAFNYQIYGAYLCTHPLMYVPLQATKVQKIVMKVFDKGTQVSQIVPRFDLMHKFR